MLCTEVRAESCGQISGIDQESVAEFTLNGSKVSLIVTDNLSVNYSKLFSSVDLESSQEENANALVIGIIPEVCLNNKTCGITMK